MFFEKMPPKKKMKPDKAQRSTVALFRDNVTSNTKENYGVTREERGAGGSAEIKSDSRSSGKPAEQQQQVK